MLVQLTRMQYHVGTPTMADHEPQHDGILLRLVSRIDEKMDNALTRLGKLESSHEQIDALLAAHSKQGDKLQDHEIRLTKIETRGGMITAIVAVVVSAVVTLVAAAFKSYSGN